MKYSASSILAAALYATGAFAQYGSPTILDDGHSGDNHGSASGTSLPVTASSAAPAGGVVSAQTDRGVVNCRNNICYSMAVPQTTTSSGSGNIYFQIIAPTTFSWVGMGMGNGMADSNMFLIYQDGQGNVTLSGRQAAGYTMPTVPTSGGAVLELLAGSGVANGWMVANFRCLNCQSWKASTLDFTSTNEAMNGAWQTGDALNSPDASARIGKHTGNIRSFAFDITAATVTTDSNPFVGANAVPAELTESTSGNGSTPDNAGMGVSALLSRALGMAVVLAGVPLLFL